MEGVEQESGPGLFEQPEQTLEIQASPTSLGFRGSFSNTTQEMLDKRKLCGASLDSVGIVVAIFYIIDSCVSQSLDGLVPGEDFPDFPEVPQGLSFTCDDKLPGYYADPETQCQVWHWCVPSIGGNVMYSFLCGSGTVFNQRTRVCDWFFKVDCPSSPDFYGINEDLYKDEAGNYIVGRK